MKTRKKILIGIDLHWPLDYHYDVIDGIKDFAEERGWSCEVESWMENVNHINCLPKCDGIIARVTPAIESYCNKNSIPLINVWNNSPVTNVPRVSFDQYISGRKGAEYFSKRGNSNIILLYEDTYHNGHVVKKGMEDFLKQSVPSFEVTFPKNEDEVSAFKSFARELIKKNTLPLSICSLSPFLARYLCSWSISNGLYVPEEISILSLHYSRLICNSLKPSISYMEKDFKKLGKEAAISLNRLMAGDNIPRIRNVSFGRFVEQQSTLENFYEDTLISKAIFFIRENNKYSLQVDDIARHLCVSRRSIERRFKSVTGKTIHEEIIYSRCKKAQRILLEKNATLTDIAIECGFQGSYQMRKAFQKALGMTPQEYKMSLI